jgi:uncharacterized protein
MNKSALKKMVLGTAQFGSDYGITNVTGKPSRKEIFKILSLAWDRGIRWYDTAPGYGSEQILGEFISVNGLQKEINISTKIPQICEYKLYEEIIKKSAENSIKILGAPLGILYFHKPEDSNLLLEDIRYFSELINEFPICTMGVSIYDIVERTRLKDVQMDLAFQFPYNLIDRRFEGVEICQGKRFARSIFLQGVLISNLRAGNNIPKGLHSFQDKLYAYFEQHNINNLEYAVQFVAHSESIDYFLFGVDNVAQLEEILSVEIDNYRDIPSIEQLFLDLDKKWIDPRNWS